MAIFKASTKTLTQTFTRTRIAVVEDQFDLMLRYAAMDERRRKILDCIDEKKIEALGLYIEDDGYMVAEVSLSVDWERHNGFVEALGVHFATNRPGWEDGVCPEVSVAANRIANEAKEWGKDIRTWVRFADSVRRLPNEHKAYCEELGFSFNSSAPGWRKGYVSTGGKCPDPPELTTILKGAL